MRVGFILSAYYVPTNISLCEHDILVLTAILKISYELSILKFDASDGEREAVRHSVLLQLGLVN